MEKQLIYNYQFWSEETEPAILYKDLNNMLIESGYTILEHVEHNFTNRGYTCLWLLAESHLAVHSFPENNKTYIELSGCNKKMNEKFLELFEKWNVSPDYS